MSGTYEDLEAWQQAMDLAESVYSHTQQFPKQELYGLTNQLRRAAVSIPSNIVEGEGRSSDRELAQFLNHARGSLYEVQTQIKLARRLRYLSLEAGHELDAQASRVGCLLNGLIRRFRTVPITSSEAPNREPRAESRKPAFLTPAIADCEWCRRTGSRSCSVQTLPCLRPGRSSREDSRLPSVPSA